MLVPCRLAFGLRVLAIGHVGIDDATELPSRLHADLWKPTEADESRPAVDPPEAVECFRPCGQDATGETGQQRIAEVDAAGLGNG